MTAPLLVATVAAVGVLHTLVPDHWAPIVVLARQNGWTVAHTARTAALAGLGHVVSTLVLGVVLWAAGAVLAVRYGHLVNLVAALALIGFGGWIAYGGWQEARAHGHDDEDEPRAHAHAHRHPDGTEHVHWHEHRGEDAHPAGVEAVHLHQHRVAGRTALLLILGSSPMFEGLPAFLAASTLGAPLLGTMAAVFAAATILTYATTCGVGIAGLQRVSLGPFERYGEVVSGLLVAVVGTYALVTA